jgi:hypothetical protein
MGEEGKIFDFRKYFKKFRNILPGAALGTAGKKKEYFVTL